MMDLTGQGIKPLRFDPKKHVSIAAIECLLEHIECELIDIKGGGSFIYDKNKRLSKRRNQIINYIKSLCDKKNWPQEGIPAIRPVVGSCGSDTLYTINSVVNKCFEYACERFGRDVFPQKIALKYDKITELCTLRWEAIQRETGKSPQSHYSDEHRFKRIVLVNRVWDTEFTASFDRGLHSQADELGIKIEDRREYTSRADMLNSLGDLDPHRDSVIVYYGNNNRISADIKILKNKIGLHVVTTGSNIGTIRQDCEELGSRLAEQCIKDELELYPQAERTDRIVLVVDFFSQNDAHEVRLRKSGIDSCFEHNKAFNHDKTLDQSFAVVYCEPPYNERVAETLEEIEKQIDNYGVDRIAAIFPRTENATVATVEMLAKCKDANKIRVYGEWLASSHLIILRRENSPLFASCCTDPYYFARYAIRAASQRWPNPLPPITPVLVTKKQAKEYSINSSAKIPEFLNGQDVRLNGSEYGWSDWMEHCCAGTYGPSRFK